MKYSVLFYFFHTRRSHIPAGSGSPNQYVLAFVLKWNYLPYLTKIYQILIGLQLCFNDIHINSSNEGIKKQRLQKQTHRFTSAPIPVLVAAFPWLYAICYLLEIWSKRSVAWLIARAMCGNNINFTQPHKPQAIQMVILEYDSAQRVAPEHFSNHYIVFVSCTSLSLLHCSQDAFGWYSVSILVFNECASNKMFIARVLFQWPSINIYIFVEDNIAWFRVFILFFLYAHTHTHIFSLSMFFF